MSTDMEHEVTAAIRRAAVDAEATAAGLPPIDTEAIVRTALEPRVTIRQWVVRSSAAAAALAAAIGVLLVLKAGTPASTPLLTDPIPSHIVAMVDSLYPQSDYVHDELASFLWTWDPGAGEEYLDGVWGSVISDINDG